MTLSDVKRKVLALIEEINEDEASLTSDPDIQLKINYIINQRQYELARVKKIPAYIELEVEKGDTIEFSDIALVSMHDVYQIDIVRGIEYDLKSQGTIIKCLSSGTAEIEYFRYPTRIDKETEDDEYEFEISDDVLEILPYGVAGDVLLMDPSSNYGQYFINIYERLKQQLDPRHNTGSIKIEGGINV